MRPFLFTTLIILLLTSALPSADAPPPPWLERTNSLRSSDPALARGRGVVEWRNYSAAAFAEATRAHKPVFLFVTAPWCHAGAEMERSVFSDVETAQRLNGSFIPVRLERDKFPETDLRLQQTVSRLSSIRGWPLCAVMTGDGEIFYGATTLALADDPERGQPGLPSVIDQLLEGWRNEGDRTRIAREAATFCQALRRSAEEPSFRGDIPEGVLAAHATHMQNLLDTEHGGFRSPLPTRFPAPRALDACLVHYARTGDEKSLRVATVTLDAMLSGGIYDQLEGGFHRLSTDVQWRVPRFEKFGAMNAEMIVVLLHAFQATHDGRYATAAEQTLRFWLSTLDAKHEFFAASVAPAARSFEDGTYYTWTVRELETLFLDERDLLLARAYFGITDTGNLPTAPLRSVLTRPRALADCAREIGLPLNEAAQRLQSIRETMLEARAHRPHPTLDHTPLTDANALLAFAALEAGRILNRDDFTAQGLRTLDALSAAGPVRHVVNDATAVALATDLASTALANARAFEATANSAYRKRADECLDRLDAGYRDILRGGYTERNMKEDSDFATALNWRTKSVQDTSEPSTNGLIAQVFMRLYALTGEARYQDRARTAVSNFGGLLADPSVYNATLAVAADELEHGVVCIKIIGPKERPQTQALIKLALDHFAPWEAVIQYDDFKSSGEDEEVLVPAFAVVSRGAHKQIARSPDELNSQLTRIYMTPHK